MSVGSWAEEDGERLDQVDVLQSDGESGLEDDLQAKFCALESGSEPPPCSKSGSSSESPEGATSSDVPQVIPCMLLFSLAFQTYPDSRRTYTGSSTERSKKLSTSEKASSKARRYYHIEYFLLPDDEEPRKVDMVVFPTLTKVFMDSGVKTVKPWIEGDKIWVTWTQNFNIQVTKEFLKKIIFYKINMKIWDTKDKVARKVRYYRLKASGYTEDLSAFDVRNLVVHQRRLSEQSSYNKEEWNQDFIASKMGKARKAKGLHVKQGDSVTKRKLSKRVKKMSKDNESEIRLMMASFTPDVFSIQLSLTPLLAGWKMVLSRGHGRSPNIIDCFLTLKTDEPIMNEQQRQELNPMTIKIDRVSCLPSSPVPLWKLESQCAPVYCKYQFPGMPAHVTEGYPHSTRIYFQDVNVIFLGDMHPGDLRGLLDGPPLVIEVHDRDLRTENTSQRPALFGEEPLDTFPNLHAFVSPRDPEFNPFESQSKTWNPYGVARVSFADLLLGRKYLNLSVPILRCEPPPTNPGLHRRRPQALDSFQPLPAGNYLEAHSQLKLRVDIEVPLPWTGPETPEPDPTGPPFGRIIFVFGSKQHLLLRPLLHDITVINARALHVDTYPLCNISQILPAIKVRTNIKDRQDLDVITGFHLLDGQCHLLILEGLSCQGLKRLWENYQSRIPFVEHRPCPPYKVLYNSQLLFRHRLYGDLDSVVYHVHLCQPLEELMRRPELYLRDTVPKPVFQALTRIYDICNQNTRLREVVTRDLLPSAAMVRLLSQQFGLPISQEEFLEEEGLATLALPRSPRPEPALKPHVSLSQDIEEHQARYLQWRDSATLLGQEGSHSFVQVPRKRFTYSQKYLSAMVDCCDPEERTAGRESRGPWLTAKGFQVTGLQKTNYLFPLQLGTAFTEEWQEGALFRNVLENVLDRDRWPWDQRRQDFELYKKPPPFFQLPPVPRRKPLPGHHLAQGALMGPPSRPA
ncbi:uncharacterized protein CFAP92 [Sorex fumeus]|uniref:uncharacterized protein CFAP92 n=1 Tax=Sorex fumeus TaxID=62283 RepID=UPI0024AE5B44|nr:uncharacterized protein CFAP92 [Sorex fumeus]